MVTAGHRVSLMSSSGSFGHSWEPSTEAAGGRLLASRLEASTCSTADSKGSGLDGSMSWTVPCLTSPQGRDDQDVRGDQEEGTHRAELDHDSADMLRLGAHQNYVFHDFLMSPLIFLTTLAVSG